MEDQDTHNIADYDEIVEERINDELANSPEGMRIGELGLMLKRLMRQKAGNPEVEAQIIEVNREIASLEHVLKAMEDRLREHEYVANEEEEGVYYDITPEVQTGKSATPDSPEMIRDKLNKAAERVSAQLEEQETTQRLAIIPPPQAAESAPGAPATRPPQAPTAAQSAVQARLAQPSRAAAVAISETPQAVQPPPQALAAGSAPAPPPPPTQVTRVAAATGLVLKGKKKPSKTP